MTIRPLTPDDAPRCDAVVRALPSFFSLDEGVAAGTRETGGHEYRPAGWEPSALPLVRPLG